MNNKIESRHPDYENRRKQWQIGELLMGGTITMQENSDVTLPRMTREQDDNYKARVSGAVLYNAVAEKVEKFQKKPFSEKVRFTKDLPEEYQFIMNDIDGQGTTIDKYLENNIRERLIYGHSLRMINMPNILKEDGQKMSVKEVKDNNIHPFVSSVNPNSLISWFFGSNGFEMAKIEYEVQELEDGEVTTVKMIDKHTKESKQTWKHVKDGDNKDSWTMIDEYFYPFNEIPLQVIGDFNAKPMIQDMAYMNLSHFRKKSLLDSYMDVSCVPVLFFKGFDIEETESTVSVHQAFHNSSSNSDIKWIELEGGKGLELAKQEIESTEAKLQASGADLVTAKHVDATTATENMINEEDKLSPLQSIVVDEMLAIKETLRLMGLWMNKPFPEDIDMIIFKDFNISKKASTKVDQLLKMRIAGEISKELFMTELKELKFFTTDVDIEEEAKKIEDAGEI